MKEVLSKIIKRWGKWGQLILGCNFITPLEHMRYIHKVCLVLLVFGHIQACGC